MENKFNIKFIVTLAAAASLLCGIVALAVNNRPPSPDRNEKSKAL